MCGPKCEALEASQTLRQDRPAARMEVSEVKMRRIVRVRVSMTKGTVLFEPFPALTF